MAMTKETDPPPRPVYIPRNYRGNALLFDAESEEEPTSRERPKNKDPRERRDPSDTAGICASDQSKGSGNPLLLLLLALLLTGKDNGNASVPINDPLILSLILLLLQ